jgi:quercetin dioxygenase-like cupin family protein
MPVILHAVVTSEVFQGRATYQTLVGDSEGSTPIRIGIQASPPGYRTPLHSHPYLQAITILEGQGEARMEECDGLIALTRGITLVIPPNVRHWFRALGDEPLEVYGVHASPHRIVHLHQEDDNGASALPDNPLSRPPMSANGTRVSCDPRVNYGRNRRDFCRGSQAVGTRSVDPNRPFRPRRRQIRDFAGADRRGSRHILARASSGTDNRRTCRGFQTFSTAPPLSAQSLKLPRLRTSL